MTENALNPKNFLKIGIKKYLKFKEIPTNTYIKLGETKMVHVIGKTETHVEDIVHKYQEKGIKYLFLKEDDYKAFLKAIEDRLGNILNDEGVKSEEKINAQVSAVETVLHRISRFSKFTRGRKNYHNESPS